jgi:hypothetical protein
MCLMRFVDRRSSPHFVQRRAEDCHRERIRCRSRSSVSGIDPVAPEAFPGCHRREPGTKQRCVRVAPEGDPRKPFLGLAWARKRINDGRSCWQGYVQTKRGVAPSRILVDCQARLLSGLLQRQISRSSDAQRTRRIERRSHGEMVPRDLDGMTRVAQALRSWS